MGPAIRRQVEISRDVVPLAGLIDRVWRYPTVLSRERYLSMYDEDDLRLANGWFDKLAGSGDFMNPEIPAADMERLREKTGPVSRWVNNAVAHHGAQERGAPPLQEVHDEIDVIFDLFRKYASLIMATEVVPDVVMSPWEGVFREARIPNDGQWREVMAEVRAVTEPRLA